MGKLNKIEQRTKDFIAALEYLKKIGKSPSSAELIRILGIKSISTISEIKAERQNIQPESWERFKKEFSSELPETFGLETKEPAPVYHLGATKSSLDTLLEIINKQADTISKHADTIRSQQETIKSLTDNPGNANGRPAKAS